MGLPSRVTSTEFLKATIIYDDCDLWSDVGFESIAAKFERSLIVNQKKLRSHELICRFSDCPAETKQLREICHPAFPELWIGHGIFEISRPRENYKKIGCAPPKKYFLLPLFLFSSFFFFKNILTYISHVSNSCTVTLIDIRISCYSKYCRGLWLFDNSKFGLIF